MTPLIYPQLFLFAYNRQVPGGKGGDEQDWDALRDRLQIHPEVDPPSDRDYRFRHPDGQGFYRQGGVGETQSLMVGLVSHSDEGSDVTLLSRFRQTLDVPANLGKTWLILGYVNSRSDAAHIQAAHSAYQGFSPGKSVPPLHASKFLNCSVFEVRDSSQNEKNYDAEVEVILICIAPSKSALKRVADFYSEWLGLFAERHQIGSAYRTSHLIQTGLEEQGIFKTPSILPNLTKLLPDSPAITLHDWSSLQSQWDENFMRLAQHQRGLAELEFQCHAFKTHLANYQRRLQRIQSQIQGEIATSDLKWLVEFKDEVAPQYQGEMEQQGRRWTLELQHRKQSLKGTEVLLNRFYQKERDRRLENAIGAAAIGVGTTTASAISWNQAISNRGEPESPGELTLTPIGFNYGLVFFLSLFLGILGGGVSWMGLNRWRSVR